MSDVGNNSIFFVYEKRLWQAKSQAIMSSRDDNPVYIDDRCSHIFNKIYYVQINAPLYFSSIKIFHK